MNPKTAVLGVIPEDCGHSCLPNILLVTARKCSTGHWRMDKQIKEVYEIEEITYNMKMWTQTFDKNGKLRPIKQTELK